MTTKYAGEKGIKNRQWRKITRFIWSNNERSITVTTLRGAVIINPHWVNDEREISLIQSGPSVHLVLTGYTEDLIAELRRVDLGQTAS